jgi:DnaK suppressor protein
MDVDAVSARLAWLRAELEHDLGDVEDASPSMEGIGFGKRVGDGTGIAVERFAAVSAHDSLRAQLAQLVQAEAALADGTYGVCEVCGQDIPPARLEARPTATRCVRHSA